ncbi:hypothetical protein ACIRPP_19000 [Streptomyces sp. NPDC101219]|uniref:hypothetical protein n=1 Tax=Streptomyces sp. NPDC101219 TaxID=3366131 RepID=UPI00382AA1A9
MKNLVEEAKKAHIHIDTKAEPTSTRARSRPSVPRRAAPWGTPFAALIAGTTGIDPSHADGGYVEHFDANNRVFKDSLKHLAAEGNDFPPSLRTPMAVIMGNHGDTVHDTTSAQHNSLSPLSRTDVLEVAKQISRDRFSYLTLQDSINREIVHDINTGEGGAQWSWRAAGHTIGFREEARYQGLTVDADDAQSKAAWEAKMDYHTWGGVVRSYLPGLRKTWCAPEG